MSPVGDVVEHHDSAGAAELPVHLTHFVGRERELHELSRLLARTRLLTLTGAGGSGKTRLAREVAAGATSEYERVGWVDFTPVADHQHVAQQVMDSLRVPERLGAPALDVVLSDIANTAALLVFDNCEHVVDACAEVAERLLRGCPRLTILATSREALGVPSETSWLVPPLAEAEGMQLFVERARSAMATFTITGANAGAVREICRRLDNLPLAIELAAARSRALSPNEIAERLDDAFRLLGRGGRRALPRHRTLRAVIDWSYELLDREEQVLLARLAVFSGSFTLDAVEEVCPGEPLEAGDLLDTVAALVDRSLVTLDAAEGVARYRLLETVRQYGVEKLTEGGALETMRERHTTFFAALAERADPRLTGGEWERGLAATLRRDADNLRAACAWSLGSAEHRDLALRLAGALFWYWYGTGQFHEAKEIIDAALALGDGGAPSSRGRVLLSAGLLSLAQGDYATTIERLSEARRLAREAGDRATAAVATSKLAAAHLMLGESHRALAVLDEVDARGAGEGTGAGAGLPPIVGMFTLFWRAWTSLSLGRLDDAQRLWEEEQRSARKVRHPTSIAHAGAMLGNLAVLRGELDRATAYFAEAIRLHVELGDVWGLGLDLDGSVAVAVARGNHAHAAELMGGVDAMRERLGFALPGLAREERARLETATREALGAEFDAHYARGKQRPLDDVVQRALERTAPAVVSVATPTPEAMEGVAVHDASLRVLALGRLQVVLGETPVDDDAWGSARTRELLVYLLLHPDGCTKEQVALAFWPDSSTAQCRNNFHVTLHRLRKALGRRSVALHSRDRYAVDASVLAEFDVARFEREATAARRALKRGEHGALAALERAVALYRGPFLDGEPAGDWHLEHRDRLRLTYTSSLMDLGAALVREGRYEEASAVYRRVLQSDELNEEAIRQLMTCQAQQGERALALRTYQQFAARLAKELEVDPDEETTALFQRLQAG